MARRMRLVLPRNWFGDSTPVLDAVLGGLGTAMAGTYTLIQAVKQQSRLLTASGGFIDSIANDFFGMTLLRWNGELDSSFRRRVGQELLRPRATRSAVELALTELTGSPPAIFEPSLTSDTGGYTLGGIGYNLAGGWGSLELPYQFFLTITRPPQGAIAFVAGYASGGIPVYGSLAMATNGPTDSTLVAAVEALLPAATIAWCRIID